MRFLALAADYDGTLAEHGAVSDRVLESLRRFRECGKRLILVTGRELEELMRVFPDHTLFDRIIVENGAVLFNPATRAAHMLTESPPAELLTRLKMQRVEPLSVGRAIIATREPNQYVLLEIIHSLGLEYQLIFNKGAVMALPTGVNKATGVRAALSELRIAPHDTVAVGDAENDQALLAACGLGVAVANALPSLKERADWVTGFEAGAGVSELIDRLLT